jgi:subtilase family serine protease
MSGAQRRKLRAALGLAGAGALLAALAGPAFAAPLPAATPLHVTVTLRPRDPAALAGYAQAVSTPGSSAYLHYLTPAQFARRFGPTPVQIARVRRSLRAHGLDPGPTAAGGLSIPLRATAGRLEHGLSVSLHTRSLPGRRTAIAATATPSLGRGTAGVVQSVLGLNTTSAPHPLLARAPVRVPPLVRAPRSALARSPHVATGGPQPCSSASSTAAGQNAHTADQIASAYDFSGLYGAGDVGSGVTVAIYELEPNLPSDIAAYQACYGTHVPVSYVPVDGGVGSGPGSGEAALDIEELIGMAPGASVIVYQGPNSASASPGSGPYDTFAAMISQDRARVISVSWGECEPILGEADASAEATLFQQAAVQGQTIVAASGDEGSEDCDDGSVTADTELAVDDPASQPFVTGVGGTTLQSLGPRPTESVWNAGGDIADSLVAAQPGAGGGGISSLWPMPRDQLDASPLLGVLSAGHTGAQCDDPGGYCREVPDVAADADPTTGYVIYWSGGSLGQPAGWQSIGGTSAAVPVWVALMALADASKGCVARPLGFAGPALYRAAGDSYPGNFNDVRSGNNDFTASNGDAYAAHAGYDETSGLGSPNAAPLAAALCADTLSLINPGTLRLTEHASVSTRLRANDPRGVSVGYGATGLPPGLSLAQTSGRMTGHPRRTGSFVVHETAQDEQGSTASTAFAITVGPAPRLSHVFASGLTGRRPSVGFTLTAGHGSPVFTQLKVALPTGMKVTSGRGVSLKARGVHRPGFRAHVSHGVLQISLRHSLSQVTVTVTRPGLRIASGHQPRVRRRTTPKLSVSVLDAGSGTTALSARLGRG